MADLATLGTRFYTEGAEATEKAMDGVADAAERVEKSTTDASTATKRASGAMGTATGQTKQFATATERLAAEQEAAIKTANRLNAVHGATVVNSKALQQSTMNLGRQFTDLGVQIGSGGNPLTALLQQLPQIADGLAVAKQQGIGAKEAFKGLYASVIPIAAPILAIGAVAASAFGLLEREIDKNTKHATTWGDTWKAVVKVTGDYIMDGPIGDGLKWLGGAFSKVFDGIVDGVMWWYDTTVGFFVAAYKSIKTNWSNLPDVLNAIFVTAANKALAGIEFIVNGVIKGVNELRKKAGLKEFGTVDLPELEARNKKIAASFGKDWQDASNEAKRGREGYFNDVVKQTDKEWEKRQKAKKATEDHTKAIRANNDAYRDADNALTSYLAKLNEEIATMGMSSEQIKKRENEQMALAAETPQLAAFIRSLYQQWEEHNRVMKEAEEIKKGVTAATNDNIRALKDEVVTVDKVASRFDKLAFDMEEAAGKARNLRFDIEDIADAINNNDWTSAFSSLLRVVTQLEVAFKNATNAQDKFNALSGVAQGVGSIVGGKTGSVISGIGSGAALGAKLGSFVPGIGTGIGAAAGAILGGLGSLFGGSSAKKQAKREEEARRQAEEAQRLANVAAEAESLRLQLLEAEGKTVELIEAKHKAYIASLAVENQAMGELVWQAQQKAEADAKAAEAAAKAAETAARAEADRLARLKEIADFEAGLQAKIDDATLSSAEKRERELAAALAYSEKAGDLVKKMWALEDAATATAKAAQEAADAEAAHEAAIQKSLAAQQTNIGLMRQLMALDDAVLGTTSARDAMRADELAKLDETGKYLQNLIWTREDEAEVINRAAVARRAELEIVRATATALEETVNQINAARQGLLRSGDITGALAGERKLMGGGGAFTDPTMAALAQSGIAQRLLKQVSDGALNVENVKAVIGNLSGVIQSDLVRGFVQQGVSAALLGGVSVAGAKAAASALSPALAALTTRGLNDQFSLDQGGYSSVLAARATFDRAGMRGVVGGREYLGAEVIGYQQAVAALDDSLDAGKLTLADYATAQTNLRAAMGDTLAIVDDLTAQQEALNVAQARLGSAGAASISYYFDQIVQANDALAASAREAAEPLSLVAQAIGRLTSISDVLGDSAAAARTGWQNGATIGQAELIARSAAIAASVLTTSEAATAAARLASNPAFAGVGETRLRDLSLLIGGSSRTNAAEFEKAFTRINAALIKGSISQAEYSSLFAEAITDTTGALSDLQKTAKGLADQLSITSAATPQLGFAEAERQYRAALASGDSSTLSGAVSALRDAGKNSFSTADQQAALDARLISDLRGIETGQFNPYVEANAPIVNRLDQVVAENKQLRADINTLLGKIAQNTGDTADATDRTRVALESPAQ